MLDLNDWDESQQARVAHHPEMFRETRQSLSLAAVSYMRCRRGDIRYDGFDRIGGSSLNKATIGH